MKDKNIISLVHQTVYLENHGTTCMVSFTIDVHLIRRDKKQVTTAAEKKTNKQ